MSPSCVANDPLAPRPQKSTDTVFVGRVRKPVSVRLFDAAAILEGVNKFFAQPHSRRKQQ